MRYQLRVPVWKDVANVKSNKNACWEDAPMLSQEHPAHPGLMHSSFCSNREGHSSNELCSWMSRVRVLQATWRVLACHGHDPCHLPDGLDISGHAGCILACHDHQANGTDPDHDTPGHSAWPYLWHARTQLSFCCERFGKRRRGHSQRPGLSAWSNLPKHPSEMRVYLELFWSPFCPCICYGLQAEAERKE